MKGKKNNILGTDNNELLWKKPLQESSSTIPNAFFFSVSSKEELSSEIASIWLQRNNIQKLDVKMWLARKSNKNAGCF